MTFANRKAERIARQQAEAGKKFKYRVRCTSYALPASVDPVLPGLFADKLAAERYAFEKLPGAPVGFTGALRSINERLAAEKRISLPDGATFIVERVETP